MTRQEFEAQMGRMIDVYGDRAYPPERVSLLWREFKRLTNAEFTELVSELIASNGAAPMAGKFREAALDLARRYEPQRKAALDAWIASQPSCMTCRNTGYVMAYMKGTAQLFAFQCPCNIGQRLYPSYPPLTADHDAQYTRDTLVQSLNEKPQPVPVTAVNDLVSKVTKQMPAAYADDFEY